MKPADLFNLDIHRHEAKEGTLIVAEPFMREPHFCHSVILMIDGETEATAQEGSMGVVMNRLTQLTLDEVLPDAIAQGLHGEVPVFSGGPVGDDRLFFIHSLGDVIPGGLEVMPGLWVGGDFKEVISYVNSGYPVEGHLRFFLGYSGWSPGQLAGELGRQAWAVVTKSLPPSELLTGDNDAYWHKIVRSMGPHFRPWHLHPQNPTAN